MAGYSGAGKGDRYRKVNRKKYEDGWENAFGKQTCLWHICIKCDREFCAERTIPYESN